MKEIPKYLVTMNHKIKPSLTLIVISLFCVLCFLAACSNVRRAEVLPTTYSEALKPADYYLEMAEHAESPERAQYQLLASKRLLQDGFHKRAGQILRGIKNETLTHHQHSQKQLYRAKLLSVLKRTKSAYQQLLAIDDPSQFSNFDHILYQQLLGYIHKSRGDIVASAASYMSLDNLLQDDNQKVANTRKIIHTLEKLPTDTLLTNSTDTIDSGEKAWYELAYISKRFDTDPKGLIDALSQWQHKNTNHPGARLLPKNLSSISNESFNTASQVALLVPLTGPLQNPGKAIRDGFMAAFYEMPNSQKPLIKVYDTTTLDDINQLVSNAISDGANLIIGPLSKDKVKALRANEYNIPVIGLNNTQDSNNNHYQFGLSPESEARLVSNKAFIDGHREAIVIIPNDPWGKGVAKAFIGQFEKLGGHVIGVLPYSATHNLKTEIKQLLHVSHSYKRKTALERTIHKKIKFLPRKRQDIDMIFLTAMPSAARQIKPMLNFYYAGKIPVYATSSVYAGAPNALKDRDLNGIIFCDMPHLLTTEQLSLRQANTPLWPESLNHYNRLYALGLDAFRIATQFSRLTLLPDFNLVGATGDLYLQQATGHIKRELNWAQFHNGIPKPHIL